MTASMMAFVQCPIMTYPVNTCCFVLFFSFFFSLPDRERGSGRLPARYPQSNVARGLLLDWDFLIGRNHGGDLLRTCQRGTLTPLQPGTFVSVVLAVEVCKLTQKNNNTSILKSRR